MIYNEYPVGKLVEQMTLIGNTIRKKVETVLKTRDITWAQFGCLQVIADKDGLSQADLARILQTDANTMRVICDGLERRALAVRQDDSADRRIHRIAISAKGRSVLADLSLCGLQDFFVGLSTCMPGKKARQMTSDLEPLLRFVANYDIDYGQYAKE